MNRNVLVNRRRTERSCKPTRNSFDLQRNVASYMYPSRNETLFRKELMPHKNNVMDHFRPPNSDKRKRLCIGREAYVIKEIIHNAKILHRLCRKPIPSPYLQDYTKAKERITKIVKSKSFKLKEEEIVSPNASHSKIIDTWIKLPEISKKRGCCVQSMRLFSNERLRNIRSKSIIGCIRNLSYSE